MRRFTKHIVLLAAILAIVCTVAGCEATKSAIASISPTRSVSVSAGSSTSSSPPSPSASVSSSPSVTATPTSQPSATSGASTPAASAQPSSSPTAGSGSGSGLIWLWVLLGVIILIGVIVGIVRARGRRSAAAGSWRSSVVDAYAKGSALHDAMSVAETPGALGAYDAGARWSDIQRRADDLTQTLYALREAAPDDESRARVADVLVSLQTVRSAMDAERAPGGADARQAEVARERLAFFEISLRALRGSDQQAF
ncbi:MAG TPA: hypothetical protein VJ254_00405 [Streptosporangiaceae bacterium]|nr:hypothetical protein [Streptosporangiaceae bacterium]